MVQSGMGAATSTAPAVRRFHAALHDLARVVRLCRRRVVGLPGPPVLGKLDAPAVDYHDVAGELPHRHQGCPARMRFHSEGDVHCPTPRS